MIEVDVRSNELYKNGMAFTLSLKPEVEERLRVAAAEEHRSVHKTVELAVEEYLKRRDHGREVVDRFRRVVARSEDFYRELGDR